MPTQEPTTCERCAKVIPTAEPALVIDGCVVCRACRDRAAPACPYCGSVMRRTLPKNHGKCPDCGETFFLRPDQLDFDATILTREQKESLDQLRWREEWARRHGVAESDCTRLRSLGRSQGWTPDRFRTELETITARHVAAPVPGLFDELGTDGVLALMDAWVHFTAMADRWAGETDPFGYPWTRCVAAARELRRRFGRSANATDITWACLVERTAGATDLNDLHRLLWCQARFLREEGRDARHILREVFRTECRRYKLSSVSAVEVEPCHACRAAERLKGQRFGIDDAIAHPPVPAVDCDGRYDDGEDGSVHWCACQLRPLFEGE